MQKYMWEPLGITNITFHPEERPDMHVAEMSVRTGGVHPVWGVPLEPDSKVTWSEDNVWPPMSDDSGDAGAYTSAIDYQKILHSITDDDGKLLGKEMLEGILVAKNCKSCL
jgi:CubicO group peptidase (beta-lactamase class C family)